MALDTLRVVDYILTPWERPAHSCFLELRYILKELALWQALLGYAGKKAFAFSIPSSVCSSFLS